MATIETPTELALDQRLAIRLPVISRHLKVKVLEWAGAGGTGRPRPGGPPAAAPARRSAPAGRWSRTVPECEIDVRRGGSDGYVLRGSTKRWIERHWRYDVKVRAIDFVVVKVSDLERSVAFYRETLGLDLPMNEDGPVWKEFGTPPVGMALFRDPADPGVNGLIALAVDDVAAAAEELRGKGVKVVLEPIEWPVCYQAVIEDPDGNVLILHQRKDGTAARTIGRGLSHHEVFSSYRDSGSELGVEVPFACAAARTAVPASAGVNGEHR
jgi:predicted enzyme related to lactoylglutathione lyase